MLDTLALFDTPESKLTQSYAPGKWTARQLLVHISDAETVLLDRLRRIAAENKPALIAFDQDLWVKEFVLWHTRFEGGEVAIRSRAPQRY